MKSTMRENKLVFLGAGGVGKTSLVLQYLEGLFSASYQPTVEDYYRHTVRMPDGTLQAVEIVDTSGSQPFPAMRELSIRTGRGFVIVFSLDNVHSFQEALRLRHLVQQIRGDKVPVILVGNKADLEEDRQVSRQRVEEEGDLGPSCRYLETSAKCNENVARLFVELLQQAEALEAPPEQPRRLSRRLSSLGNIHLNVRRRSSLLRASELATESKRTTSCVLQ